MKKFSVALLAVVALTIFSCKKKEADPAPPAATTTGSTSLTGTSFSGLFSNQLWTSVQSSGSFTVGYAQNMVFLSSSDFTSFNLPTGVFLNAGSISLNGTTFKNSFNYYTDSTNTPQQDPFIWQATGSTVPAFSFTNTNIYPTFSGHSSWTDTITKSAGLNCSLSGITNMDEAYISITGLSASSPAATLALLSTASNFSFSASALSSLSTSTTALIQVDIYRNNVQTINGKKMNFRNVATYVKTVGVKN